MTDLEQYKPAAAPVLDIDSIERQATLLAGSSIVPRSYKGKPGDIVAAAMMGGELGFGVMTSLRSIHVVDGKPQLSAEAMNAIVRRAGHSISGETSSTKATATGTRRDTGDTMTYTFTIDDARNAGLANKGPWKSYPAAMMWARAVSNLCRHLFPDVALGAYTLGEIVEPDEWAAPARGDVIDVDTGAPVEPMADPAETAAVFDKIEGATPEQQMALLAHMETHGLVLTEPSPLSVVDAVNAWFVDHVHRDGDDIADAEIIDEDGAA